MKKFDQINVIPFIDIMLVLLAIVLMTATFISQGKISIDVPTSDNNANLNTQEVATIISLDDSGIIYLDDIEVSLAVLKEQLAAFDKNQTITMRVDAEVDFQQFISVTDILYQQEMSKINIVTEKLP